MEPGHLKYGLARFTNEIIDVDISCQITPEQRLFVAVINQAFADATLPKQKYWIRHQGVRTKTIRWRHSTDTMQARAWLLGNSDDFRAVCDLAGMNSRAILLRAQEMAAVHWGRPAKHWRIGKNARSQNAEAA